MEGSDIAIRGKGGEKNSVKRTEIRIPYDLWVECRRAQEAGAIQSLNHAAIMGIRAVMREWREAEKVLLGE